MVFGLFALPDPFQPGDRGLEEAFGAIHFYCAWAMIAILAAHVGAALQHHCLKRDDVLRRMTWPRRG